MAQAVGFWHRDANGKWSVQPGGGGGADAFTDLSDTPANFSGAGGYAVAVNASADGLEFTPFPSGGASSVLGLSDTPGSYTDTAHHFLIVNMGEDGVVFANPGDVRTILNVADGANNYTHPNHSGDVTSEGDGATTIQPNAVTLSKLATINTQRLLGRNTAGTGNVEELSALPADIHALYALAGHDHSGVYSPVGHNHAHNDLTGLTSGDPHTQYLLADGSRAVTSPFSINGAPHAQLILNGGIGTRGILAATGGVPRWTLALANGAAESGSDAGSNFTLVRFDDSGTFIDAPIAVERATGDVTIANDLSVDGDTTIDGLVGLGDVSPTSNAQVSIATAAAARVALALHAAAGQSVPVLAASIPSFANHLSFLSGNGFNYNAATLVRMGSFNNGSSHGPRIILGRNSNGSTPAAGHASMTNLGGTTYRIWPDAAGNLRINDADPTNANDKAGVVVGAQGELPAGGGWRNHSVSGVAGTAVTLLPSGTVTGKLFASGVVVASNGSRSSFSSSSGLASSTLLEPGGGESMLYQDAGPHELSLRVNANGSVDVRRTAGNRTYSVAISMTWI